MKKLVVLIAAVIVSGVITYAQDAAELKNAGNAALKIKDYATALAKYEAYLTSGEEGADADKATIYNTATCAYKLKKYDVATKYYNKAIDLDYKADIASYYIAKTYDEQGDEATYIEKIKEAYDTYTVSKYRKKFLTIVTSYYNKLAAEPYNKGNNLYNAGAASGSADTYKIKVKEAKTLYAEAKTAFEKTLEVDPNNATAKAAIANIESNLKAYQEYIDSL